MEDNSKTSQNVKNIGLAPQVSPNMAKSVSDYRRAMLQGEVGRGLFKDGSASNHSQEAQTTSVGNVAFSSTPIKKTAQLSSSTNVGGTGGNGWTGASSTVRQLPEVYSPLWLNSNLNLPRDRATINAWCRSFYVLNPIVQNAINLHSTYPISKLSIKCKNKKIENFFNEMIEEIDLMNICVQVAQEYWLLGEAFVYAELNEQNTKWSRLILQNPDYIVVKKTAIASEPLIMLRPDENLRNIVKSNKPADIAQRKQLNESIIEHVKRGQNIPLDNFYVSHLSRKIAPYEIRGTGLPVSIFRQLMLFDQLRENKFVQAASMINPLTLVKIGSADYKPTFADLEQWRSVFAEAEHDKNFKIFTHEAVTVERVGYNSGIIDIAGDVTQLVKEMYIGLEVPSVLMDGGGDITYANGGVSLDVLRQRYMSFRTMMSSWLKRKIFQPIAQLNDFHEYIDGKKHLIIPDIEWPEMAVFQSMDYINILIQMSGEKKQVSTGTLYKALGLVWEDEDRKIRKEAVSAAIREKEAEALKKMSLNDLKALGPDDDVPEITETPLNSESPYEAAGQAPPDASGGGGGLLGSLPGMEAPGGGGSSPSPSSPPPSAPAP